MDPVLGAVVSVPAGRGIVRFCGATSFAAGKWVGIELLDGKGKNDGTINGVAYFRCKPNCGVFVRPSQVKVHSLPEPERKPSPAPPPPATPTTPASAVRPGLSHKRTSSVGPSRRLSIRSIPSSPRSDSPAKAVPSALATATAPSTRDGSMGPPKRVPSLNIKSLSRQPTQLEGFPRAAVPGTPRNASPPVQELVRPPLASPAIAASPLGPTTSARRRSSPPRPPSSFGRTSSPLPGLALDSFPKVSSRPPSVLNDAPRIPDDQELHELRAKVRVLEAKRADEARRVRELEARLADAEAFVALRPKLQAKLGQQQTDLIAARRELADARQLAELAETRGLDAQEQLEMAALDREVAEERAETAELELEEARERLAVVEVELAVVRGGGDGAGGQGANDQGANVQGSLPYIQLEKQNERLKEALVRLRDLSQETDAEQRRRLAEMEKDIMGVDELQTQYDSTLIKLSNAEVQIEDLKLQLDDSMGAEEMLMQLTERNLMLGEKIEEMRITIEDLEALKELNDELEENHVETEKTLQEEITQKEMEVHAQQRKISALEETCQDLEGTISQFRELVMQLQTELDALRTQTQSAQQESASASQQTATMMSLNLKLQSSAAKNQARAIELELKKIEAREANELLSIVQPYLPQAYVESDSDATNCYLFFQRLGAKVDLISAIVAQAHGLPDALGGPVSDVLVGICELRSRIAALSTLCRRFAATLRRCDASAFLTVGRVYPEIAPVEKRVDIHVELLRRDEFREMECVSDLVKIQAQFEHISETYFEGFEHDLGERELGLAWSLDHDLDMFAAAVALTKTSISSILKDDEVDLDIGGADVEEELFAPLQSVLQQTKGAKALSKKLTKRLEDLVQDSNALKQPFIPRLNAINNLVPELTNFAISLAQQVMPHISDAKSSKSSFQISKVLSFVRQTAASTVGKNKKDGATSWQAVSDYIAQVVAEISSFLPLAMEQENVTKVSGKAPWVVRVDEIKASMAVNLEAERKVAQLGDELQGLARTLKSKDQHIQESTVKIELMERRMEAARKQADTIGNLEGELAKARRQERAYEEAMEQLQADLDALEQDNAKLKAAASHPERQASEAQRQETETVAVEGSLETSYLLEQLEALRGTVRYLRTENSYLKGQDLLRDLQALPPLPEPINRIRTPPLSRSPAPGSRLGAESDDEDDTPPTPPTLRALALETKVLYRDVIRFSASPRVVDLSATNARRAEHASGGRGWMPRKQSPAHQVLERKAEAERLSKRVKGLIERANGIGGR